MLVAWRDRGDPKPLERWLVQELDDQGIPRRVPVTHWWFYLDAVSAVAPAADQWPPVLAARVERFLMAALRWSRAGGATVFTGQPPAAGRGQIVRNWASNLSDPSIETLAAWWFPGGRRDSRPDLASPPLPAQAQKGQVLAMLRADWRDDGDLIAIEQRQRAPLAACHFELVGSGQPLIGPSWTCAADTEAGPARPADWVSGYQADVFQWTSRLMAGGRQLIRTVALLRGRRMAIVAQRLSGLEGSGESRLTLAEGVEATPLADRPSLRLRSGKRTLAEVLPLALPYPGESSSQTNQATGSLAVAGNELVLKQAPIAGQSWMPLLFSWDPDRQRRKPLWRTLTITERSQVCPPEVAVAYRVSWGRGESLVVFRSLKAGGPRVFLGYQTKASFFVGLFDDQGEVRPIVSLS